MPPLPPIGVGFVLLARSTWLWRLGCVTSLVDSSACFRDRSLIYAVGCAPTDMFVTPGDVLQPSPKRWWYDISSVEQISIAK